MACVSYWVALDKAWGITITQLLLCVHHFACVILLSRCYRLENWGSGCLDSICVRGRIKPRSIWLILSQSFYHEMREYNSGPTLHNTFFFFHAFSDSHKHFTKAGSQHWAFPITYRYNSTHPPGHKLKFLHFSATHVCGEKGRNEEPGDGDNSCGTSLQRYLPVPTGSMFILFQWFSPGSYINHQTPKFTEWSL